MAVSSVDIRLRWRNSWVCSHTCEPGVERSRRSRLGLSRGDVMTAIYGVLTALLRLGVRELCAGVSARHRYGDLRVPTTTHSEAGEKTMRRLRFHTDRDVHSRPFLLTWVQPALSGLMDGSLSTLAPIFAVVLATHQPRTALFAGLATALGAGISMAFSEGLSDTGDLTGRGNPFLRGAVTGLGTFAGGVFHTVPFLIPSYRAAITVAIIVVAVELLILAWVRSRFFETSFARSFLAITVGGVIIAGMSAALGAVAAG
jgi:hypothetical protein